LSDKVEEARRCMGSLGQMASNPAALSGINISAIMHRTMRLATHDSIRAASDVGLNSDVGHEPILRPLLREVVRRAENEWEDEMCGEKAVVKESIAALALYSCGMTQVAVPQEEIEVLAQVVMETKDTWRNSRIVMMALALGRLGSRPMKAKVSFSFFFFMSFLTVCK